LELWKSDGTDAGTIMIKDINAGPGSSVPWGLINANGTLYFQADDGINGTELWKSNGTDAGTIMVKDIKPGINGSNPSTFTNINDIVYFQAQEATNGIEFWKTDGTDAGTVLVKDINPGAASSEPNLFTNVNGQLFFYAGDITSGQELWQSDGTSGGTELVIDIATGTNSSSPDNLINVNGILFFVALNNSGRELWAWNIVTAIKQNYYDVASISIYPNPTMDKLNIAYNKDNELIEIILYDISSRLILQQTFTNSTILSTEQMQNGIYFYELRNSKGTIKTGKLVKQ